MSFGVSVACGPSRGDGHVVGRRRPRDLLGDPGTPRRGSPRARRRRPAARPARRPGSRPPGRRRRARRRLPGGRGADPSTGCTGSGTASSLNRSEPSTAGRSVFSATRSTAERRAARSTDTTGSTSWPPDQRGHQVQRVPAAGRRGGHGGVDVQGRARRSPAARRAVASDARTGIAAPASSASSRCSVVFACSVLWPPIATPRTVVPLATPEPAATYSTSQTTARTPTTAPRTRVARRAGEEPAAAPVNRRPTPVRRSSRSGCGGRAAGRRRGRPRWRPARRPGRCRGRRRRTRPRCGTRARPGRRRAAPRR